MSWFGAGIGAVIGTILGGPLGGAIGGAVGHLVSGDDEKNENEIVTICPHCGAELIIKKEGIIWNCAKCNKSFIAVENLNSEEDIFTYLDLSIYGLIAKIAKADGVVSKQEAQVISRILDSFCGSKEEREIAKHFYNEARKDNNTIDYYAELLYSLTYDKEEIRRMVYQALFEVASADGGLEEVEKEALIRVLNILKLDISFYNYLYEELISNTMSIAKAYEILGCSENSSDEEIRRAYKQKVKEFHPDRLMSKGLPEAFIKFANEQMNLINQAYEVIRKVRKF
jgi:DnaJ like chaperone protein